MQFFKNAAYLIDSENVGSTWTSLLSESKVELYIFVTANAKSLNFTLLKEITENKNKNSYKIIECETGKNSLDFYLSSYLGYLIGRNNNTSYTIVSQDKGYDNVISFWKGQGIEVKKLNTKPNSEPLQKKRKVITKFKPSKNATTETRVIKKKEDPNKLKKDLLKKSLKDAEDKEIESLIKVLDSIPSKQSQDVYVALVKHFKQEDGLKYYSAIKRSLNKYYSLSEEKKA